MQIGFIGLGSIGSAMADTTVRGDDNITPLDNPEKR